MIVATATPPDDDWIVDEVASPIAYLPGQEAAPAAKASTDTYDVLCSEDLVISLAAKGFTILTGPSGTGKSRAGLQLAQAVTPLSGNPHPKATYALVSVGSDWTDGRYLLGYKNPFGKPRKLADGTETNETYEITDTLRLLLAASHPNRQEIPHFLILDEMNLSHVERYFSAFLSLLEANRSANEGNTLALLDAATISLIADVLKCSEPESVITDAAENLAAAGQGLPFAPNLFIIGTVNVDETTYMFSPKVLDRAHVIELHSVPPKVYIEGTEEEEKGIQASGALAILIAAVEQRRNVSLSTPPPRTLLMNTGTDLSMDAVALEELIEAVTLLLNGAYKLLEPLGFAFGFRVVNEVFDYLVVWLKAQHIIENGDPSFYEGWQDALDKVFLQKVLPKIHGNRRQLGDSLLALRAFLEGSDKGGTPPAKYKIGDAPEVGIEANERLSLGVEKQMEASRKKLSRMSRHLVATGYVTFVE